MREQLTAELELTAAELKRSNKELEQFAYVASHDLQEPLRKIQAFSDRLIGKYSANLEGQGKDYLDRMQNAAARMRQLINDLLTYSRISTRSRIEADVDLNEVAREVLDDLDDAVSRQNAEVHVGTLPTIKADALQMRQLFQNLVSNALKFSKAGAPARITIGAEELSRMPDDPEDSVDRKAVRLTFRDEGIGIDPAYSQRIFQVFQRLHGRDEYEGTGIGLAIVRKIVERHGGTISVESSPGNGACFAIVLPQQYYVGDEDVPPSGVIWKGLAQT
jgi:light-regulated signal transduction histidine kinase (bacteriophytochrome)